MCVMTIKTTADLSPATYDDFSPTPGAIVPLVRLSVIHEKMMAAVTESNVREFLDEHALKMDSTCAKKNYTDIAFREHLKEEAERNVTIECSII